MFSFDTTCHDQCSLPILLLPRLLAVWKRRLDSSRTTILSDSFGKLLVLVNAVVTVSILRTASLASCALESPESSPWKTSPTHDCAELSVPTIASVGRSTNDFRVSSTLFATTVFIRCTAS